MYMCSCVWEIERPSPCTCVVRARELKREEGGGGGGTEREREGGRERSKREKIDDFVYHVMINCQLLSKADA